MDRNEFDLAVEQLIEESKALTPEILLPDLPCIKEAPDVPAWYDFEGEIWKKGEEIRQLLHKEHKKLKKSQIDGILEICGNAQAKRGRESFVMLLGKKAYVEYAPQIASLLHDKYVSGHAVDTLYKMGTPAYVSEISAFLTHNRTWIRNKAKQYVQKYGNEMSCDFSSK